jgi:hypothetical protein
MELSGGSLEYLYFKINQAIDDCKNFQITENEPVFYGDEKIGEIVTTCYPFTTKEHLQFFKHLKKVSKALHDLEWVMDADMCIGDEMKAIKAVLRKTRRVNKRVKTK